VHRVAGNRNFLMQSLFDSTTFCHLGDLCHFAVFVIVTLYLGLML
jgi:hypothetical protein